MKKVNVKSLKGNEILALPIVTDGGTVLIHADVELKPELINRAIRLGIKSLYIKDYPEEVINKENYNHIVISSEDDYDDVYNEGQDVSDSECADVKNEKKTEYNNKYIENHIYKVEETAINSRTIIKNVLEKHIYRHNSDLKIIGEQAEKIIESVIEEPEVITNITEMRNISTDMYTHCINVCALSTIMALRLKMSEKQVRNISIGAILHDIGLRYIKVPYMNTNETYMNVKDALEYKKHTIFGYSSLQDEGWIPDIAKEIILLHHERIDGKGYPFQHKGDKIKTEVKLVSLCDDFESLISGVGSPKLKIYEAIEYIKANQGIKYDATITDKLLESVAVYPVGINVITSEGEMGVVVRQNHKFTDRPVIRMLKHADGSQYKDDVEKDLMEYLTLFIVDTE
uniref:HD-GYP domain-containing protein n=2 Tax=Lachnospira sp. TaxID=2049031 RepID=UPI004027C41F